MQDIIKRFIALDYERIKEKILYFLSYELKASNKESFVLGLSGGLDSAVTATLASLSAKTLALILPHSQITPQRDVDDAIRLAKALKIDYRVIDIADTYDNIMKHLTFDKLAAGNLLARLRMCMIYYHANVRNALVLGTSNRSEILIGYFTKFGDGAADLLPLGSLYKLQVRALGRYLKIDENIIEKKSGPMLWREHTAEKELGMTYEEIDSILYCIFDLNLSIDKIVEMGFKKESVMKVMDMHRRAHHKRAMPKLCIIQG